VPTRRVGLRCSLNIAYQYLSCIRKDFGDNEFRCRSRFDSMLQTELLLSHENECGTVLLHQRQIIDPLVVSSCFHCRPHKVRFLMLSSSRVLLTALGFVLMIPSFSFAAVYTGVIKEFNAKTGSLTISIPSRSFTKQLSLSSSADIKIDGKPASADDILVGYTGTVSTTGTEITRVSLKTSASPAKPKPTSKSKPDPEPMPEPDEPAAVANTGAVWPQLRGPNRDGLSTETGLNWNWGAQGPKPLWSQKGFGEGYSSVSIADGKVFTMGTQGDRESVFAVSLTDGKPLWATPIGSKRGDGMGGGPRATPTIDGDFVYALSANGDLACLTTAGVGVWSKNILQEFGGGNIAWGISESVLIDGDKLICTPGGQRGTMVALNKRTGQLIWTCQAPGNPQAGYSSTIVIQVGAIKQYVNMVHDRIIGVSALSGQLLWEDRNAVNDTANCSAPVQYLDSIFYATGYNTGGSLVSLEASGNKVEATHKYHTRDMKNHHGGMVLVDGFLYGSSDPGVMTCLDPKTGDIQWQDRAPGKGSITYADGHLIVRDEKGPITLLTANPEKYEQLAQFETPGEFRSERQQWAYPVIADKKLFIRDQDVLLVYDLSK